MVKLVALGDLALSDMVADRIAADGPIAPVRPVLPVLAGADVRVGNLEAILTNGDAPAGTLGTFMKAPPAAGELLVRAGIDVVGCANNHCMDFGPEGLHDSLRTLERLGVEAAGARATLEEARSPVVLERKGIRFGFLSYCDDYHCRPDHLELATPAPSRDDWILEDVRKHAPSVEILVVLLHWGYEFQLYPMLSHRDRARRYAEAGADLVLCHHAHVPMGTERWGRSLIAHGLGNFLFSMGPYLRGGHPLTNRSFILEVECDREGVTCATMTPTAIREDGVVELLQGGERTRFLKLLNSLRIGLQRDRLLAKIGADRSAREVVAYCRWFLGLARAKDPGAQEVARALTAPRQKALASRCSTFPDTDRICRLLGDMDRHMESEDDLIELARRHDDAELEQELTRLLARIAPSSELPGRLP